MAKIASTDPRRFARYHSVITHLLSADSFDKPQIFANLPNEKRTFIGRVINKLKRDGYLVESGSKRNPRYSWSAGKEEFDAGRWIDQQVFTFTVKLIPLLLIAPGNGFSDQARRLLRLRSFWPF